MISYLKGRLVEKSPVHVIVDCGGVGYYAYISLHTYTQLADAELCKIFVHEVIREDARMFYGFSDEDEREVFRKLISVSGVGAGTARVILSSLGPEEVKDVIVRGDVNVLKAVKGIGAKTAQRIIVDLQDKIQRPEGSIEKINLPDNTLKIEALSALTLLGFDKSKADKTLDKILKQEGSEMAVEQLIKLALKQM